MSHSRIDIFPHIVSTCVVLRSRQGHETALLAVRAQRVAFDPNIGRPEIPIMGDFACWPCQSALAKKGRPGGRPLIEWLDSAICSIRSASPIRGRICECTYKHFRGRLAVTRSTQSEELCAIWLVLILRCGNSADSYKKKNPVDAASRDEEME